MRVSWRGVLPAMTTELREDGAVDHAFLAEHCRRLVAAGCSGLVPLGSLGEGATLGFEEKVAVLRTAVGAVGGRVPIIPGISALSTEEAVRLAHVAEAEGCSGLMVLPPLVYSTDWREMKAHVVAVIRATRLPTMLYNNPAAYKTDFLPRQIAELAAEESNLAAVKESSGDVRRITAIRSLVGNRLELLVGLDDCVVEAVQAGAVGWIAGLVNAFPGESVELFRLAVDVAARGGGAGGSGDRARLEALYRWFLPLLRLDGLPKFVQYIKFAQEAVGMGSRRVRAPRLQLVGEELEAARRLIADALRDRPATGA